MEQTKILLIGAGGFLGCRVARYWTGRYRFVALSHRDLELSSPDELIVSSTFIAPTRWC